MKAVLKVKPKMYLIKVIDMATDFIIDHTVYALVNVQFCSGVEI